MSGDNVTIGIVRGARPEAYLPPDPEVPVEKVVEDLKEAELVPPVEEHEAAAKVGGRIGSFLSSIVGKADESPSEF